MKICIISSIFYPYARGGAEQVVYAQAWEFAKQGHQVLVITCAPFQGWGSFAGKWEILRMQNAECKIQNAECRMQNVANNINDLSIKVFRFTPLNLFTIFNIARYSLLLRLFWHVLDMFNLHTYFVTRRIFKKEKPDLIITRNLKGLGYTIPIAIGNWKLEIGNSTKWINALHDLGALHPRGYMEWGKESAIRKPIFLVAIYRAVTRQLFGSPDGIVAPSQFVLDEYTKCNFFPRSQRIVIQNPAAVSHHQLPNNSRNFLYLGQLEPYKGLRLLLNVWREFVIKNPDAKLEIIGQGSMQKEVKRAERDMTGLHYGGFVAHNEIFAVFKNINFLIMPSLAYETFGLVVAESFSAGVPVIASRIGALPELIKTGFNGFLFNPGDEADCLKTINQALKMQWLKLSINAQKSALTYTIDQHIKKLHDFFESLI